MKPLWVIDYRVLTYWVRPCFRVDNSSFPWLVLTYSTAMESY